MPKTKAKLLVGIGRAGKLDHNPGDIVVLEDIGLNPKENGGRFEILQESDSVDKIKRGKSQEKK